jgi:hypothetical protein
MDESAFRYRGWCVVFACFVMAVFGYGLGFYGNGVYLAELTTGAAGGGPKLATSTVSAAMTLYHFVSAFLVIFVSDAMARLGPRLVAGMGATALALALYLISRVSSGGSFCRLSGNIACLGGTHQRRNRQYLGPMVHGQARACHLTCN